MLSALLDVSWGPIAASLLVVGSVLFFWLALSPAGTNKAVVTRLQDFVDRTDIYDGEEMQQPLYARTLSPLLHRLLASLGRLLSQKDMAAVSEKLSRAGDPGGLTVLDFVGLRIILAAGLAGLVYFLVSRNDPALIQVRNVFVALFAGFMLPKFWLSQKIKARRTEIARALPDALDMLTIGVEAGLAFESALLRVGDQWDNALSQEFRRVVSEMRIGVPRNESLRRMAERTDVEDLSTFVAVLIQSNMLGVSIGQVLKTQADQMRLKRRQYAEEMAHAATVKIVVVLVFFILPALFIVILGPAVPRIVEGLSQVDF